MYNGYIPRIYYGVYFNIYITVYNPAYILLLLLLCLLRDVYTRCIYVADHVMKTMFRSHCQKMLQTILWKQCSAVTVKRCCRPCYENNVQESLSKDVAGHIMKTMFSTHCQKMLHTILRKQCSAVAVKRCCRPYYENNV